MRKCVVLLLLGTLPLPACDDDKGPVRVVPPTAPTATAVATTTSPPQATPTDTSPPSPTLTPTPSGPRAQARQIIDPADLIGGPLAVGRVGDFLLANDEIRVIIRKPGRDFSFLLTYGGNIVDADLARAPGEPGRDNLGGMTPLINIASTVNVQEVSVVNDGEDGEPAIIRSTGVDDLFDAIDPTNAIRGLGAGEIPESAQDKDIPVEVMTEYSLAPGDNVVRIETTIKNLGDETLNLYVGDYINPSGELDVFTAESGYGEALILPRMPFVAYTGVGAATGVSYGIVPAGPASAFNQSGFIAYLLDQNLFDVLLAGAPGAFTVLAGDTNSFVRHFVVGDGDPGSIADARNKINGFAVGTLQGRVTAGGEPAEGAVVTVVRRPGRGGAEFNVIDSFYTDEAGRYAGTVPPGNYLVMASLEGHPYDSGTDRPAEHPVSIQEGAETVQDITLPNTGWLRVTVSDENEQPVPAKVTVVGFDPSPDPMNFATFAILDVEAFIFGSPVENAGTLLFGVTDVHFLGPSGQLTPAPLEPGEYEVVVTHGPEYSAHRQRVTVTAGETVGVDARVVRVVDSTGFVSADYHVHLINSLDSNVTREQRILTMLAEGVDYFAATDHDFLTDLQADIEALGATQLLSTVVGSETTTFNIGHFNLWPLEIDPDSITGGVLDWGRAGVPAGMDYPSLGSYELSPTEIMAQRPDGVVQVNHINDETLGYFHLAGIDTALVPPQSFTDPTKIRQEPSITNLYDDRFTALELWVGDSRDQTALLLDANLGDWFNLLNQGLVRTAIGNSDTHATAVVQAGGPRNFVASSTDAPADLDDDELAANVNAGRVVASNAPFVRFTLEGDEDAVAGLELGKPLLVPATGGQAKIRVNVQSPEWAAFDTIDVYANATATEEDDENLHGVQVPRYKAVPTLSLVAGQDFEVNRAEIDPQSGAARLEADVEVPLSVTADTWVVVVVRGTDDVSRPMWPMNPKDLDESGNETLDDLTDGNLGEEGNLALAFTSRRQRPVRRAAGKR
jgi:hypothetical protein